MDIKILGSGCKKCIALGDNVRAALNDSGVSADILKVADVVDIAQYGVMSTPALVIDEKVVSVGKVLNRAEIVDLLQSVRP